MIRGFKIALASWLAVYLQSTAANLMTFWGLTPSLAVITISLAGLKQGTPAAVWTGLWAGFLADCFHPASFGLYSAAGTAIGFLAGLARERIYREQLISQAVLIASLTMIYMTLVFFGREGGKLSLYPWYLARFALGSAGLTSIVAVFVLPALERWIYARGRNRNAPGL